LHPAEFGRFLSIVSRAETEGQSDMAALAERGYDLVVLTSTGAPATFYFSVIPPLAVLEKSPTSNLFVAS